MSKEQVTTEMNDASLETQTEATTNNDKTAEATEMETVTTKNEAAAEVEATIENNTPDYEGIIAGLKQDVRASKEKHIRLLAEFDNVKKRTARERLDLMKTAGKDIIMSLLPILDDFERAFKAAEKEGQEATGFTLIYNKLKANLEQKGLKAMQCIGEEFDADLHEAITEIPAPSENLQGKIIDEIEKGYYLNDKIIRYAKVVIGR